MMTAHIYPDDQIFIRYDFATELFIGQHECFFACSGRIDLGVVLWGDSWKIDSAFQMVMQICHASNCKLNFRGIVISNYSAGEVLKVI